MPIKTFSSGATNSMRGASYLAGIDLAKQERSGNSVIVVDVGGTTTDVGVLLPSGFPRQAAAFIKSASNNLLKLCNLSDLFLSSCWSQDKVLLLCHLYRMNLIISSVFRCRMSFRLAWAEDHEFDLRRMAKSPLDQTLSVTRSANILSILPIHLKSQYSSLKMH